MKIVIYICVVCSFFMNSFLVASESTPVRATIMIDEIAQEAQQKLNGYTSKTHQDYSSREILLKREASEKIHKIVNKITEPGYLYTIVINLMEGYPHNTMDETLHGQILFQTYNYLVMRIAQLRTREAYDYFVRLKNIYGRDGAGSLIYRSMEFKYLKAYSRDSKVISAKSSTYFV